MGLGNKIPNKVTAEITQNRVIESRGVSCFYARYEDALGDKTEFLNPNENLALYHEQDSIYHASRKILSLHFQKLFGIRPRS